VEKSVPLRRLTTIIMPHRGPRASLRQQKKPAPSPATNKGSGSQSDFRTMSAIQILKFGLTSNLWKKQGWLFDLLHREGLLDATKQSRKDACWSYYKSQLLYIEALQEAKDDAAFDPRRSDHLIGRDGKFMKKKRIPETKKPIDSDVLMLRFRHPVCNIQTLESRCIRDKEIRSSAQREQCHNR
jgi:hypothetical protein